MIENAERALFHDPLQMRKERLGEENIGIQEDETLAPRMRRAQISCMRGIEFRPVRNGHEPGRWMPAGDIDRCAVGAIVVDDQHLCAVLGEEGRQRELQVAAAALAGRDDGKLRCHRFAFRPDSVERRLPAFLIS